MKQATTKKAAAGIERTRDGHPYSVGEHYIRVYVRYECGDLHSVRRIEHLYDVRTGLHLYTERDFVTGKDDVSEPVSHYPSYKHYDGDACACCFLGFGHSMDKHNASVEAHRKSVEAHAARAIA